MPAGDDAPQYHIPLGLKDFTGGLVINEYHSNRGGCGDVFRAGLKGKKKVFAVKQILRPSHSSEEERHWDHVKVRFPSLARHEPD